MEKQELIQRQQEIREELWRIELAERISNANKLVGKFLMYHRNCYSCPEKESDYWNVYYRVLSVDKDGYLETIKCEIDSRGEHRIQKDSLTHHNSLKEISGAEFRKALRKFEASVDELLDGMRNG